ncbi:hypothetical protein FRC05_002393 [Tulasnella sp. 425]|nr:hypothetical protein FRC05_002393 [Tulasnella sp. 425]
MGETATQSSGDGGSPFQPSAKLRAKLERLAQWRIDPSLIEFPGGASEFRGGHATVSRAFLASTSDFKDIVDKHQTDGRPNLDVQNPKSTGDAQEHEPLGR